ncbi:MULTISPECIES: STAS domain-containing protein [Clostridia]|uniref:STAS domain-containing protein n=1 Tax=Clostridia TaxID=186801 RepID=UPI000EA0FD52|nr:MULTISPECIES: STAS domain-containing protein [Clostridia]NBJ71177.1 PAS domain-containing protein [Roseburia sp. 1XD42-34]RKI75102.1 PAS domain-containing protein [Clostridium sp. 1xD42-85]
MVNKRHEKLYLFEKALNYTGVGLIITDPNLEENPIIFVNRGFTELTGYMENEVVGKNCRFLQGTETDPYSLERIRQAIQANESITIQVYNYKKDGTGFWNELSIDPMWVEEEQKYYFVGVQKDVTNEKESERLLQNSLLEIEKLSTPIVPIRDDVAVLPLIGNMNDQRMETMMANISTYMEQANEEYIIIDLSGLHEVDTYTVSRLLKIHQFILLMGKKLLFAGIRPDMALKTVIIQDTFKDINTFKNVKMALHYIDKEREDK